MFDKENYYNDFTEALLKGVTTMTDFTIDLKVKKERFRLAKLFDDVAKGLEKPSVLDPCKPCMFFDEEKFDCKKHCICPYADERS